MGKVNKTSILKIFLSGAVALFLSYLPIFAQSPPYAIQSHDGAAVCSFGSLPYRVYFPINFTDTACVIHVSRGGNGLGDDRGQLLSYVEHYVQQGYVVVQVIQGKEIWNARFVKQ